MVERNLILNEIASLQDNRDLEFGTQKKLIVGHIAWAKAVLNKSMGSSLINNNLSDKDFKFLLGQFQARNNIKQTSKLDFITERILLENDALLNLSGWNKADKEIIFQAKTKIEDWTHKAVISEKKKKFILNRYRDPRIINALVLHQMAYKVKDRNGQYSNPEKYLAVGAHFCIMLNGRIIQYHPVSRFIWHSNCTSHKSVGVEFEGNFPDIKGKWWYPVDNITKKKVKTNEDKPTSEQFESGRFLLTYLKLVLNIKYVLAHRQSSDTRENDPGPDIWFNIGQWGIDKLGLNDGGKESRCGSGKAILPEWRSWKNQ